MTTVYTSAKKEAKVGSIISFIIAFCCFLTSIIAIDYFTIFFITSIVFLVIGLLAHCSYSSTCDKERNWISECDARYEAEKKRQKAKDEYYDKVEKANKSIEECTCENMFNMHSKRGYHTYTEKVVGTYYRNITREKTLDAYLKLAPCKADAKAVGVYSYNDVLLGYLPKVSPIKEKMSRILPTVERVDGYASINIDDTSNGFFKFQINDIIMGLKKI